MPSSKLAITAAHPCCCKCWAWTNSSHSRRPFTAASENLWKIKNILIFKIKNWQFLHYYTLIPSNLQHKQKKGYLRKQIYKSKMESWEPRKNYLRHVLSCQIHHSLELVFLSMRLYIYFFSFKVGFCQRQVSFPQRLHLKCQYSCNSSKKVFFFYF